MKIIWDNLQEIKDFLSVVDISRFSKSDEMWGGLGVIIDDRGPNRGSEVIIGPDTHIITPKAKELSWLFRNLYEFSLSGKLSASIFLEGFRTACIAFFIEHKDYEANDLLLYVIDFIERAYIHEMKEEK